MKVFVTGPTGFVGNEVVRQLLEAGHRPRCLVRRGSEGKLRTVDAGVEICHGDATEPETLRDALRGCEAVIHLIGIIREFPERGITFERLHVAATANVLAAAQDQGVRRYLHMSSNGTREDAVAAYHRTKWQAEERVRASGLDWTIFRPSVIFGPGDAFVNMLADLIRRLPAVPVIGDGEYRLSPVAVQDVARGFVRALEENRGAGETFACGGPEELSYNRILDEIGAALGKGGVTKIHSPVFMVRPMIKLLQGRPDFPITEGQLTMLLEGNTCDGSAWRERFAIAPLPFGEGIRRYLAA